MKMILKNILIILLNIIACNFLFAQQPNMQMVQQQMKRAQQQLDSVKKAYPEIQQALDKYKQSLPDVQAQVQKAKQKAQAEHPEIDYSKINVPSVANIDSLTSGFNFNSINNLMLDNENKLSQLKSSIAEGKKNLPVKSAEPLKVNNATATEITRWTADMLATAKIKNGVVLQSLLDEMYADTTQNAASVGMLLVANGLSKYAAQYLVCKYLLSHPNNAMAINDVGIFMRLEKQYIKAIQLFLYAQSLNDTCFQIKSNLAWAYAYAGDFTKAKQYFNTVLQMNPNYSNAMEGLSLIAYQEGDRQALWNSLTKQLFSSNKTMGFSGSFPSPEMASLCGGIVNEEELNKIDKGDNASGSFQKNNAYDNPNEADPSSQSDEQSLEQSPDISYDIYNNDFPQTVEDIDVVKSNNTEQKYESEMSRIQSELLALLKNLPKPMQFINDYGELETIYNYSDDAHYIFFRQMHIEFGKRCTWIYKQTGDKLANSSSSFGNTYLALNTSFNNALKSCNSDACVKSVMCEYVPKIGGCIKSYVMSVGDIVSNAINDFQDETDWYRNAAAPMLQYISESNWNKYLNAVKEADVRIEKLKLMQLYQHFVKVCGAYMTQVKGYEIESGCEFEALIPGVNISTPKLKHLKTLAPPCKDDTPHPLNIGKKASNQSTAESYHTKYITFEDNCNHTKVALNLPSIGKTVSTDGVSAGVEAGASVYWEKLKGKNLEDDTYKTGIELTAKVSVGINAKSSTSYEIVDANTSAGVKAEMQATLDISRSYNADGQLINKSIAWSANASVSGKAGFNTTTDFGKSVELNSALSEYTKMNNNFFNSSFSKGVEAKGEYIATVGADGQLGNYQNLGTQINSINK